jgi:hypothetical protein
MIIIRTNLSLGKLRTESFPRDTLYLGAAGFEERALGFMHLARTNKKIFDSCIGIQYEPHDPKNRKQAFSNEAKEVFRERVWMTYNRFEPEDFARNLAKIKEMSGRMSHVIVDVSAMSKMLIVLLLHGLRELPKPLTIVYTQAKVYSPTEQQYRKASRPKMTPIFLTSDVFQVVTTNSLSSIAMQGAPQALVAFPNFNYRELAALLTELNPQHLILIETDSSEASEQWRVEAIRKLNQGIATYLKPEWRHVNPFDLRSNLSLMEDLYENFYPTHRVILAPTGGKLQAVACFIMKNIHPDIHVVYPVVRRFAKEYTKGYLEPSELTLGDFRSFVEELNQYRTQHLLAIQGG